MVQRSDHRGHVMISGASTGIGRACALQLANLGFYVLAGVRRQIDGEELENQGRRTSARGGCIRSLQLDVTDGMSIAAAGALVRSIVADRGLAGLVNNAGVSIAGTVEFLPLPEWRRQFEINFFGAISLTQVMLPLLRMRVAASGLQSARILNMSSIAGIVAQPVVGPYTASKFALESLTETLRLELRAQGIHVCAINPGAIDTPMWKKGKETYAAIGRDEHSKRLYGELTDNVIAAMRKTSSHSIPPAAVAKAVSHALTSRRPKKRYLVGTESRLGTISKKLLPERWFEAGLARFLNVPKPPIDNAATIGALEDDSPEASTIRG